MTRKPRIVIAGAGVAGSIVAQLLPSGECEVMIFERMQPEDHSNAGTGLNVGPNALKSLTSFLPDLAATIRAASLPWASWRTALTDGTLLMDLPLASVADNPGIRIRWAELYALLRQPIHERICFGNEIVAARYARAGERGPLIAECSNGETIDGIDLLVAADGRYSALREQLVGRPEPRHLGVAMGRALVPSVSPLVEDYGQWFNGPNRLLAFQVPGAATYVTAAFPLPPGAPIPDELKHPGSLADMFRPAGGEPDATCRWLMQCLRDEAANIHWARIQEADIAFRDEVGHLLLLGDAAHPMIPTLGQGATQAIEDACLAGAVIAQRIDTPFPAVTALIDRLRSERLAFIMTFSREASDTLLPGRDPVQETLRKTKPDFLRRLARAYRESPTLETLRLL